MTHVLVATPTAGGVVKALYGTTLVKAVLALKDAGSNVDFLTVDSSYIAKARNYFAHILLSNPHFTHLLMIDSDMSVDGHVVRRMLRADKPVVATAYSQRRMDMGVLIDAARRSDLTPADLTALALEYNIAPESEPGTRAVKVANGMCRVRHVALGCSMIRRDAFEALIAAGLAPARPDGYLQRSGFQGPFHDFFGEIRLEDGDMLSEDYSFCRRWLDMEGSEVWAIIDEVIGHIGDMVYGAPYVNRLSQGKA